MPDNDPHYAAAKTLPADAIPVIDAEPLIRHDSVEPVSKKIMSAAKNTGFFYISNHGIDPRLIEDAFRASRRFFHLPPAEKSRVAVNKSQRGWLDAGMTKFDSSRTHDLKEVFFYGPEKWHERLTRSGERIPLVADNLWPDTGFIFRDRVLPYYHAVVELGHRILSAIAVGMGEDRDFFASRYTSPLARGQLVYYPRSTSHDEAEQRFGAAAHTDFGVLTLLMQDDNGGLQVLDRKDRWVEAPPIENTFVCNIGDLLHRWTNSQLSSNFHRVINRSGNERFSMPVFFDPDPDTVIDSRDFRCLKNEPPIFPPTSVAKYIDGRNRRTFSQYKSATPQS